MSDFILTIKLYEDDGGMPGEEIFSTLQATGYSDGWNERDLSTHDGFAVVTLGWIIMDMFSALPFYFCYLR